MNNTTKISLSLAVLAALAVGVFYYFDGVKETTTEPEPKETSFITGCYVANLGKDVYTLLLEEQNSEAVTGKIAYNNYQKDSSSGSFAGTFSGDLLKGNYSFDSEGSHSDRQLIFKKIDNSFVQGFGPVEVIDGREVFISDKISFDPKSTFVKSESCTNLFTENNNTFSFSYNPYFFAYQLEEQIPTTEWSLNSKQKGIVLGNVVIQKTFLPGTNFIEARLKVGRSTEANAIKNCTIDLTNGISTGSAMISGYPFSRFEFSGAAAGNLYETTSYRGIVDGDCYAIEYTIHSSNIDNYSPEQEVKEFDKIKIQNEMEKTIKSFNFIISSD